MGLEDGKVAACNEARNTRGKNSVADDKWHMLAWVVENKCVMAYDDTTGEMAKAWDAPLCNFNCYAGNKHCHHSYIGVGYPYGSATAPTALDEIQVYHNIGMTGDQLEKIRTRTLGCQ